MAHSSDSGRRRIVDALLAASLPLAASLLGSYATMPNIPTWYAGLEKPAFNPPNWVFGPVWTLLYILMAIAFYRILRFPAAHAGRRIAIYSFVVQIVLNAAWSFAFFAAHSPIAGLAVIVTLWLAIAVTLVSFMRLDRVSGWLLAPYLAWVSYAFALNVAIWRLNG